MDHRPFGLQNRAWSVEQVGEDVRFPLDMDRREGNPFRVAPFQKFLRASGKGEGDCPPW